MLSDRDIRKALASDELQILPHVPDNAVQPASIDLHLANTFWVFPASEEVFDPFQPIEPDAQKREPVVAETFDIHPGQFVLASTTEHVTLSAALVARIEGKSSLGRLGLFVHITAGFIDPGFSGNITLELLNVSGRPLRLHAGMKIAQLSIQELTSPAERPYGHPDLGSKYQGQTVATPSLYHLNSTK
jgi:dCTP deaminase